MKIEIDQGSGFCFGVTRAINKAEEELARGATLYCLGDIVHNGKECDRLKKLGLITIDHATFSTLHHAKVLLRAHGEPPATYGQAETNGIEIIDATCPVVLHLQERIKKEYQEGGTESKQIVIYGKNGHAEVLGLVGQTDGKAIVIITHKLHEVMSLSDKVAVLRKGQYIGTVNTSETNPQALTDMMVGHAVTLNIDRPRYENPVPRLTLQDVTCYDNEGVVRLDHVSFTAMGGEILGVAGIAGSGQRELLESIAGLYPVAEGSSIRYTPEGAPESELVGKTPMQIKKSGVALAFVPEDRLGMGLVGSMGMTGNMMLRSWKKGKGVFVNRKDPNELAMNIWKELEVVTPSTEFPVRRMSGGNVQKVLVGREIASAPNVLMSAYAVRGLDINTSYTIYNLMTEQKMKGVAVIFVGEDLDVLLELCDRILVLCGGKVSGIVDARTATKEEIGLMMTRVGGGKEEAVHA